MGLANLIPVSGQLVLTLYWDSSETEELDQNKNKTTTLKLMKIIRFKDFIRHSEPGLNRSAWCRFCSYITVCSLISYTNP